MDADQSIACRWARPVALLGTSLSLAVAIALPAAGASALPAASKIVLQPGVVVGNVNPYVVKRGDTLNWIAARYAVHPVRITKPSAKELQDGMERDETIYIDQRRVLPTFQPELSGIVLNLPEASVYLVDRGVLIKDYPVGVSNAEWKAPIGRTRVVNKAKNPTWYVPIKIQKEMAERGLEVKTKVAPGPLNPLGPRWIGFSDGTFGFHGTTSPTSIKRYASHGCVRFLAPDIIDLFDRVSVGMPVTVAYQPVTFAADRRSIWISVFPDYYETGYDYRAAIRQLAAKAGVSQGLHWPAVEKAIRLKDGILMDVGQPLAPSRPLILVSPSPKPTRAPSARPTLVPTPRPSISPVASPTLNPNLKPSFAPYPTATPVPSYLPESTPVPEASSAPYSPEPTP